MVKMIDGNKMWLDVCNERIVKRMGFIVKDILKYGKNLLFENGIEPREARLLLAYSMGISADDLIKYVECNEEEYEKYITSLKKRIEGVPYAYITGHKEFMKLDFKVNENTLIPREDTEILVQEAMNRVQNMLKNDISHYSQKIRILDLCTGSGCIAIALAKYVPEVNIDASDISKEALRVASENATNNDVQINFIASNLFERINEKYDLIVSNPPYIVSELIPSLQKEVQHEPHIALDGGKDGLDFYKKIVNEAIMHLNSNGYVIFEIGYDQGQTVANILENMGYENIEVIQDYGGNDRVVLASHT